MNCSVESFFHNWLIWCASTPQRPCRRKVAKLFANCPTWSKPSPPWPISKAWAQLWPQVCWCQSPFLYSHYSKTIIQRLFILFPCSMILILMCTQFLSLHGLSFFTHSCMRICSVSLSPNPFWFISNSSQKLRKDNWRWIGNLCLDHCWLIDFGVPRFTLCFCVSLFLIFWFKYVINYRARASYMKDPSIILIFIFSCVGCRSSSHCAIYGRRMSLGHARCRQPRLHHERVHALRWICQRLRRTSQYTLR